MKRRAFIQSALVTAAWTVQDGVRRPPDRHSGKWIIPTNKPDRFGLKVMAFNPIRCRIRRCGRCIGADARADVAQGR